MDIALLKIYSRSSYAWYTMDILVTMVLSWDYQGKPVVSCNTFSAGVCFGLEYRECTVLLFKLCCYCCVNEYMSLGITTLPHIYI